MLIDIVRRCARQTHGHVLFGDTKDAFAGYQLLSAHHAVAVYVQDYDVILGHGLCRWLLSQLICSFMM
jgi:hypothetical protein